MNYNRIIRTLFILAVVVCPLIFFTDLTRNPYAIQLVVFQIILSVIIGIVVLKSNREGGISFPRTVVGKPLVFFFLFCLFTFLYSFFVLYPQWKPAILSFGGRRVLFLILNAMLLFYITLEYFGDKNGRKRIIWALFTTASIASAYGVLQYLGIELIWSKTLSPYGERSVSTFGNPNFMSSYLVLIIPVIMVMLIHEKSLNRKMLFGLLGGINIFGLFVTETRSSWLGLFVALTVVAVLLVLFHKDLILRNRKWLILLTVVLIIMVMIPYKNSGNSKRSSIFNRIVSRVVSIKNTSQSAYTQRFLMWSAALSMVKEHPLTGVGWGNYEILYPFHQAKYLKAEKYAGLRTHSNNTHNEILEIVTQVGIVGLGLYIWLFYVFFRRAIGIYKGCSSTYDKLLVIGLCSSIIGMFVDNMLNVSLHFPMPAIPFWINMGLVIAIGRDNRSNVSGKFVPRKSVLLLISLLAGAFVVFVIVFNVRFFKGDIHYFKGFKSARQGNLENATRECLLSYESYPLNVDNNYELGNAYARLKNKERAIWAYEKAIEANPGYDEIYFNLGVVYAQLNNYEKALTRINQSVDINPLFKDSYLNLGNIYIQKKQWKKAVEAFRECLALAPDDKTASQNLSYALTQIFSEGQGYIDNNNWEKAEEVFRDIAKLVPDNIKAHLYLGNIYFSNKKYDLSVVEYKKVLDMSGKKDINIMNNLGLAYFEANMIKLAAGQFREILRIDPGNTIAAGKLKEIMKNGKK